MFLITLPFKTFGAIDVDASFNVFSEVKLILNGAKKNGDYGNAYAAGQCTYWAYERRRQMGIGTPSYLGNGGDWWRSAPSYGLRVDHNPQVGAALSFLPGQDGADGTWGHVAVVEAVYGDGTFQISEMNVGGLWMMNYRTLTNLGQYWFVH